MQTTIPAAFKGRALPLTPQDITNEAAALQCTTAIIHAFSDLESGGVSGFLPDGRPKILFEARTFHLLTRGKFDAQAPNISSQVWNRGLYGAGGTHQYHRLAMALTLDEDAALQSCSIGKYQVMGSNFRMIGYGSAQAMWAAFCDTEKAHLDGFGAYCKSAGLVDELQADPPEFVRLAVGYNGPGERANGYDQKLEVAFDHYSDLGEDVVPSPLAPDARTENPTLPPLPPPGPVQRPLLVLGMVGEDVARLQRALGGGLVDDGRFGGLTLAAVRAFQAKMHVTPDGKAGAQTQALLRIR